MNRKRAAAIDLDNCISDDAWRTKLIKQDAPTPWEKYEHYHSLCAWDSPFNLDIVRQLAGRYTLFIFTARPELVRRETEDWLRKNMIPFHAVFMRANDDHHSSVEVKRSMLMNLDPDYEIVTAIDDRVDVLDMYAQEGVRCCRRVFIDTHGGHA